MKRLTIFTMATIFLAGCGSINVVNDDAEGQELVTLRVIKATATDDGTYKCGVAPNIIESPIPHQGSYVVRGLSPGRYCVNGYQVDVPIIGQIDIYLQ